MRYIGNMDAYFVVSIAEYFKRKGIVKILFEKGWWEVQLDCTTGAVYSTAQRHADWIEQLHDGSIISAKFKLISMNLLGIGLALMVLTGIWLWYGPKLVRRLRR